MMFVNGCMDGIGFCQYIETACSLQCNGKQLLSMKTEDMHIINKKEERGIF